MRLPDFLIVGAPKCGTTSLHSYLNQHPQLFMSAVKEPHFFAFEDKLPIFNGPGDHQAPLSQDSITCLDAYTDLFKAATNKSLRGESSTMYLYLKDVPYRIRTHIPDVKLIAILRHPLERAFSHFLHMRREGREPLNDFEKALNAETKRIAEGWSPAWHYKNVGCYAEQLERYFQEFDANQVRVYLYDDWKLNPSYMLQDMFAFLGVDNTFEPNMTKKENISFKPKNTYLYKFLTQPNQLKEILRRVLPSAIRKPIATQAYKRNISQSQVLSSSVRQRLMLEFKPDISKLQNLLERDLTSWLV